MIYGQFKVEEKDLRKEIVKALEKDKPFEEEWVEEKVHRNKEGKVCMPARVF